MKKPIIIPTPKYKINQMVYFLTEWDICFSTIVNILIEVQEISQTVKYQIIGSSECFDEQKLFGSKEELFRETPLKQLLPF